MRTIPSCEGYAMMMCSISSSTSDEARIFFEPILQTRVAMVVVII